MKIIEILFEDSFTKNVIGISKKYQVEDFWVSAPGNDERRLSRILVDSKNTQNVLDALQGALVNSPSSRILVMSAEAILPRAVEKEETQEKSDSTNATREELYSNIEKNTKLDPTFLMLVFLSTVVVAIGLIEDKVSAYG